MTLSDADKQRLFPSDDPARHAEGAALIASEAADQALRLELERGIAR